MIIHQLSVFLENKSGRLAKALNVLGNENINIIAMSVADTSDFGILRMIVSDPDKSEKILKENSFSANKSDVIAISVGTNAKNYAKVLQVISDLDISVEYTYAFYSTKGAVIILQCDNNDAAIAALKDNDIVLLTADEVYNIA
ncbi:MAG: ACT domain-containing protein [Bacteroidales bacterium]|nr:ACT domain-containing protein [Bacteroidales bacterium]